MKNKVVYWGITISFLVFILLVTSVISLGVGSSDVALSEVIPLFVNGRGTIEHTILFDIRLPRIILGFAIGGSLSLAGVILQGMFRNPLVEPYTLGISGGAALGVSFNIVLRLHQAFGVLTLPLSGFLGAMFVALLVYFLSLRKGILNIQGLLLTGVMISFISSSLIMLIMAISGSEELRSIVFWTMGSLDEPNIMLIKVSLFVSLVGLVASYFFAIPLNAMSLGEDEAKHLGVDVEFCKKAIFILASLLTGVAVSVAGIIGFVGLVVPHFMSMLVGNDKRILIITSFLGGGAFLVATDMVARTIVAPIELPVGVITGIVGGTVFVVALSKREDRL